MQQTRPSPFKGEVRRGMGVAQLGYPHPHPDPPLEGEGEFPQGNEMVAKTKRSTVAQRPAEIKSTPREMV